MGCYWDLRLIITPRFRGTVKTGMRAISIQHWAGQLVVADGRWSNMEGKMELRIRGIYEI